VDKLKKIYELPVGARVEVQVNKTSVPLRFQSEFVGISKKRWFIIAMPDARKFGDMRDAIYEGVAVVVRFVIEGDRGEVIAFRSDIEFITNHPTKLLFIDMPQIVESRPIRASRRFDTLLPFELTKIDNENQEVAGQVTDLSANGCQAILPDIALDIAKDARIEMRFRWLERDLTIAGIVRDTRIAEVSADEQQSEEHKPQTILGIQFARTRGNDDIKDLLAASLIDMNAL